MRMYMLVRQAPLCKTVSKNGVAHNGMRWRSTCYAGNVSYTRSPSGYNRSRSISVSYGGYEHYSISGLFILRRFYLGLQR